jgi:acetyltransferase-like isoleucine patch superfamily enzyme
MSSWRSKTGLGRRWFRRLTEFCNRSDNAVDNANRAEALGFAREDNVTVAPGAIIRLAEEGGIGPGTFIGLYAYVNGAVTIGRGVLVGPHCCITSNTHKFDVEHQSFQGANQRNPVVIGDGTWLAAGCTVTPGVTVGRCNLVCANCVVTRSTPDYAIVAGTPGRVVGRVDPQTGELVWFDRPSDSDAPATGEPGQADARSNGAVGDVEPPRPADGPS